jgi:hypothetical protein
MPLIRKKPFAHAWHRCWSLGVLMTWCTHVGLVGGTKCPMPSESCPTVTMMPGHSRTTASGLGEKILLSDKLVCSAFHSVSHVMNAFMHALLGRWIPLSHPPLSPASHNRTDGSSCCGGILLRASCEHGRDLADEAGQSTSPCLQTTSHSP